MSRNHNREKIPVAVSSCLLGEPVRYDGTHKKDHNISRYLQDRFDFVPCCPEVAIGLGVPREPIQLVRMGSRTHVRAVNNPASDLTRQLQEYGSSTTNQQTFYGYIFKARSPSCGIRQVPTFNVDGMPLEANGRGAYAQAIIAGLPGLPVIDEDLLRNARHRDDFIEQVFTYHQQHATMKQ